MSASLISPAFEGLRRLDCRQDDYPNIFGGKRSEVNRITVRSEIISQFQQVAEEHEKQLPPLADDLELLETGLDSLCFAVLVVRLEESLGVDPFTSSEEALFPVTFGGFVSLYEQAAR